MSDFCKASGCLRKGPYITPGSLARHEAKCAACLETTRSCRRAFRRRREAKADLEGKQAAEVRSNFVPHGRRSSNIIQEARPRVPSPVEPPAKKVNLGRGLRKKRPTTKVRDMQPAGPILPPVASVEQPEGPIEQADDAISFEQVPDPLGEPIDQEEAVDDGRPHGYPTIANAFGLWRVYSSRPAQVPDEEERDHGPEEPTAQEKKSIVANIIAPYPNLSAFWYGQLTSIHKRMSNYFIRAVPLLIAHPQFIVSDFTPFDYPKLANETIERSHRPWEGRSHGWRQTSIPISIPELAEGKPSQKKKKSQKPRNVESEAIYEVDGFWYRPIIPLLKSIFTSPESKGFHYEPFEQWWSRPGSDDPPVRVYDESYSSASWIEEHRKIQELVLPPEETDDLPRVVAAMMVWSDSTHLADYGQASAWPIYMALGNQTKYDRAKPGSHALHHLAYLPHVRVHPTAAI